MKSLLILVFTFSLVLPNLVLANPFNVVQGEDGAGNDSSEEATSNSSGDGTFGVDRSDTCPPEGCPDDSAVDYSDLSTEEAVRAAEANLGADSATEAADSAEETSGTERTGRGFGNPDGIVPCSGLDCDACSLVDLIKEIIDWLIQIMLVIFAIVTAVAGFRLVTSGGNPQAKTDAKKLLTNAFIGIVIVLLSWVLVDTVMRALLGNGGELIGGSPWSSSVQCNSQVDPN